MKLYSWILVCFTLLPIACQKDDPAKEAETNIVGGMQAGQNAFENATVAIREGGYLCSGIVVADNVVLTAAHCTHGASMTVLFSARSIQQPERTIAAANVIAHPEYSKSGHRNDLLLVVLKEKAPVTPVRIAPMSAIQEGSMLTMVGFGLQADKALDPKAAYGIKMKVSNPVTRFSGENILYVSENNGTGTCQGDSGGPAFVQVNGEYQLAGVTSAGGTCGQSNGLYTFVPYFKDWIVQVGQSYFGQSNPFSGWNSTTSPVDSTANVPDQGATENPVVDAGNDVINVDPSQPADSSSPIVQPAVVKTPSPVVSIPATPAVSVPETPVVADNGQASSQCTEIKSMIDCLFSSLKCDWEGRLFAGQCKAR